MAVAARLREASGLTAMSAEAVLPAAVAMRLRGRWHPVAVRRNGSSLRPCIGCGGEVTEIDGPVHRYVVASPGCWARFNELGARWWGPAIPGANPGVQRISVDAYMVQHPGLPEDPSVHRQAMQSVAVHLVGLYLTIEQGIEPMRVTTMVQQLVSRSRNYPRLDPPAPKGWITVVDVVEEPDATLVGEVHRWARSAWNAWKQCHDQIAAMAATLHSD